MIPQIFFIGPLPINSFGLMVALSFFAGIFRLAASFENDQIKPELAEKYVLTAGILGLIGARVLYLITFYDEIKDFFWEAALASGGFVFYGGLLTGIVVFALRAKLDGIAPHRVFDAVGPTMALAYAIGRLGCQLSGDGDYGVTTTSWLGMSYETGVIPTPAGVLALPTPLFESAICFVIIPILLRAERSPAWRTPWSRTGLYLVLLSVERFFIEFIRINPVVALGLTQAQLAALFGCAVGTLLLVPRFLGKGKS